MWQQLPSNALYCLRTTENKIMAKPIPDGFHTITPHIVVADGGAAMDFYQSAFGAKDCGRHFMPDGKSLMHGLMKIGDSFFMLAGEFPPHCLSPKARGGSSVTMSLYVEDVDAVFNRAVKAGCKAVMPVADQFWGDRYGVLEDPFGHSWSVATHKHDYTPEQMAELAKKSCPEQFASKP
jgi:PhnB protein